MFYIDFTVSVLKLIIPSYEESESVGEKLDEVSKLALSKGTWLLTAAIGESSVSAKDASIGEQSMSVKLSFLQSKILDYFAHIGNDVYFYDKILLKVRSYTKKLHIESEQVEPVKSITRKPLHGADVKETKAFNSFAIKATFLFPRIRKEVTKTFKDWAKTISGNTEPKFILGEPKFA